MWKLISRVVCHCIDVIFFRPEGHFVINEYFVLLNMKSVYHIVAIRVNEHPGHTYGGFISAISERGMTSGIRAVLTVGRQPS
jgi:hypothetical protein